MKLAYPFIQARNFTPAKRSTVDLIVVHTMENPEKPGTARAVAAWFSSSSAPRASAHFCIDGQEVVQCVDLADVAWHAPGANRNGIGLEHAGYAKQSSAQWDDAYSRAMLERSAFVAAELCRLYRIPAVRLTATDLRAGAARGICGHGDVSKAFKGSDHWDPGPNFPWASYIARVAELARSDTDPAPPPTTPVVPPMPELRRGMYDNDDVKQAQMLLNQRASTIAPLTEDGDFGGKTEAAVIAFQVARGLPASGVIDQATWRELHR